MSRNRLNLHELPLASLRATLAFLKAARAYATYEFACMSLAGAFAAALADLACPHAGWLWFACSLFVLGLILLAGALVRTLRRARRQNASRRGRGSADKPSSPDTEDSGVGATFRCGDDTCVGRYRTRHER